MDLFLEDIKSHFKLDFIDKILISIVFILAAVFSPVFADEVENIDVLNVENIRFSNTNTTIYSNSSTGIGYFPIEPGYTYTVKNVLSSRLIAFSNSVPELGVEVFDVSQIQANDEYTFNSSTVGYFYFNYYNYNPGVIVTRVPLNGQESVISGLITFVGFDNIWTTFSFAIPYIAVVVLCVIGLLLIKRLIMSLSKAKTRI